MKGDQLVSPDSTSAALRDQALADLQALIEMSAQAQKDVRSYQAALEKNYRHLSQGGRAVDMTGFFDVASVRAGFTDKLDNMERARNRSRRSLWRLQLSE